MQSRKFFIHGLLPKRSNSRLLVDSGFREIIGVGEEVLSADNHLSFCGSKCESLAKEEVLMYQK